MMTVSMADPPRRDTSPDGRLQVLWMIKGLNAGGAEMLLLNQARAAAHDRVVYEAGYLVPWKDALIPDLEAAGVPTVLFSCTREWDLRWAGQLRRHLRRHPIDVVHVHSPYVAAVVRLVVRTLPRAGRPAVVYTEHNEWDRHKRLTRTANRLTIGLDDADFAVSDQVRTSMTAPAADAVEVLVHGIDLATTAAHRSERDEVRAELGIAPDEVVVGIVANFRREKAYEDWIEAARLVPADVPVRFVSVGQGPLEDEMRALVDALGLAERVLLLGYRHDPLRVMSGFDIFSLASIHEGLPVSLMDALALGLPVAATRAGGIPQAITDGVEGLLVEPRRPDQLADAIERLARDSDLRRTMGKAAEARAADYDVTRALTRIEDRYREVARTSRG
jgi:glycosyltransferase involved in cell wall biosynthesis